MKKLIIFAVVLATLLLGYKYINSRPAPPPEPVQTENYFDQGYVPGLFKAHEGSKVKVNDAVEKENQKLNDALNQAGM